MKVKAAVDKVLSDRWQRVAYIVFGAIFTVATIVDFITGEWPWTHAFIALLCLNTAGLYDTILDLKARRP